MSNLEQSAKFFVEDCMGPEDAERPAFRRAVLRALAAHLQVELPPDGWRASQYRQGYDGKVLYQNSARAWLGQLKSCHRVVGPFATAADAARAVSALEEGEPEEQRSGESAEEREP